MAWLHAVIDVPEDRLVASASFWGQALSSPPGGATRVAAHDRWHTMRSPGRLLFCFATTSHHELPAPMVARLVDLDADAEASGPGWQVLRDPAGLRLCATDNSPSTEFPRDLS